MQVQNHELNGTRIAELHSDTLLIKNPSDALDLLGTMYYEGYDGMIIQERHLHPSFFDLRSNMAGEILQKFSNYRMRLFIVGDFSTHTSKSKSLGDFIRECNRGSQVRFANSVDETLQEFRRKP